LSTFPCRDFRLWKEIPMDAPYPPPNPPAIDPTGKATAGFVLGLIGMLAWIIPLFGLPITVVGLVLSIKGMASSKRGLAIAGLVLSIIGVVLTIINASIGAYQGIHGQNWLPAAVAALEYWQYLQDGICLPPQMMPNIAGESAPAETAAI